MSGNNERQYTTAVVCEWCGSKKFYNDMVPSTKGYIFVDQDEKTAGVFQARFNRAEAIQDMDAHLSDSIMQWSCGGCNKAIYYNDSIVGKLLEKIIRMYIIAHKFIVYNNFVPPGFEDYRRGR